MTGRMAYPGERIRNSMVYRGATRLWLNPTVTGRMIRGIRRANDVGLHAQYPKPRCWQCKQYRDPRLKGLGYDLREVRRTEKAVLIHCPTCHHR